MTHSLSAQAQKLYKRLQEGRWYPAYHAKTPKAMDELVFAGLVAMGGRPKVIELCYVPKVGFKSYEPEVFESAISPAPASE